MSSFDWKFHCDVLSLPENASLKDIKDAYRRLAQRWHPDHNGDSREANEKFQRINASYLYLTKNFAQRKTSQAEPTQKNYFGEKRSAPGLAWLRPALAALSIAVITASLTIILQPREYTTEIAPQAATQNDGNVFETNPSQENKDPHGRAMSRCELQAFRGETQVNKKLGKASEWECSLSCYDWMAENSALSSTCSWNGAEFARKMISPAARATASAQTEYPGELPSPFFIRDREPEYNGNVPLEVKKIRLGEEHEFSFIVPPIVWIGDSRLIRGSVRVNSRSIIIKPIRRGVTAIVLTDATSFPIRKIIYNIE